MPWLWGGRTTGSPLRGPRPFSASDRGGVFAGVFCWGFPVNSVWSGSSWEPYLNLGPLNRGSKATQKITSSPWTSLLLSPFNLQHVAHVAQWLDSPWPKSCHSKVTPAAKSWNVAGERPPRLGHAPVARWRNYGMSLWIGLQVSPIEEAIEACNINSGVFSGSSEFAHVCTVFSPKPPLHLLFAITCEVAMLQYVYVGN